MILFVVLCMPINSIEWGVLKRQTLLNFRFIQTFCIIANQAQALGVHNIKIMMTKWLQKRNCRVVKLPQVPLRLYADIYFILMLHQPLYNSCRDIKHYKCQYIWQNRGYFFLFMRPLSRDLRFFPRNFIMSNSGKKQHMARSYSET